ncbi:MAG: hypothetical protein PHI96_04940 [Desulfovibrio sp.]|nr:hypothetical protein [Desulfovibrio sp.]
MTMPYSPSRAVYEGNDAATRFPFSFKVWDATQLVVTLTSPDNVTTEASNWTADLGASGGEIVYLHDNAPLPAGWRLAVTRDMPFTQEVNLVSASRFDPQVIEDALDQATAERQQVKEMLWRAVIMPATSEKTPQDVVQGIYAARDNATSASTAAQTAMNEASHRASEAATQANVAQNEANRAKDEADRAADMANIGPATPEKTGFVKIGKGLVVQDDGTISVPSPLSVCSTAADVAEKSLNLAPFALAAGTTVQMLFAAVNTAENPTLNINATGARPITCCGVPPEVGQLAQGQVYTMIYSGSAWQIIGGMAPYPIGQYVWWEDELVRPGFQPANANIVANFAATYPQMAAYLSTAHGANRCFASLAEYEAAHDAAWATLADGSKVSWNNIGGVAKFFWNKAADTLLMPDLTEMTRFMAGTSLGVSGAQGDQGRNLTGRLPSMRYQHPGALYGNSTGVFIPEVPVNLTAGGGTPYAGLAPVRFDASRVEPTGPANAPRRWGALACAYFGQPAS